MTAKGLSERRGLRVLGMSASALRYQPRPDRNGALRDRIVALAQRHRCYGASMIYLKLRQAGELVNHKRVERLYTLQQLHAGGIFPMRKDYYCNTRTFKNHARLARENLKCRLSTDARGKGSQE